MVSVSFHVADRVLPNLNDRQKDLTDVFIHFLTQETIITMKHKIFLVATILIALITPHSANAYDFSAVAPTGQTLYYNIIGSSAAVTPPSSGAASDSWNGYPKPTGNLTIPSSVTYSGITYAVTSIESLAFYYCNELTSVIIPNSVTSIEFAAFGYCDGLLSVTIPNSVVWIGNNAFSGCSGLTSISIPNSVVSIGDEAFSYCSGLTSVALPNNITSISSDVFYNCSSLISIVIPNGVTSIGDAAFAGCSGLTTFIIPNSVTFIGNGAFGDCSGLTSITIPDSVTLIGNGTFWGCSSLTSIIIPNNITSIGSDAFVNCSSLMSITIPNSVTSIGDASFRQCISLDTVFMMPTEAPTLGAFAFDNNASGRVFVLNGCSYDNYYYNSTWNSYRSHLCEPLINIALHILANDYENGSASIIQSLSNHDIRCDSTAVIVATANYGYHFSHWSNGSTANPDTLHLVGDSTVMAYFIGITTTTSDCDRGTATHNKIGERIERIIATPYYGYHFDHWSNGSTANPDTIFLMGDSTVIAFFERNTYHLTAEVNDASLGSLSMPLSDSALYQDTLIVVATPNEHYHVGSWDGMDIVGISTNKDTVWVKMTRNSFVSCNFEINTYTVNVVSNNIIRGMVESNGTQFAYGTPCTVTATAYTGYTFAGWSNGVTANPYTFAVVCDVELTALFVEEGEEVYTVTVESADPTMGTVDGGGQALSGGTLTIRAIPNEGYRFLHWNDDNTDNPRVVTVTENVTYTAYFESTTQGIHEAGNNSIAIYPNPTNGIVKIASDDVTRIDVYNVNGQLVKSFSKDSIVDISSLPSGAYTLRVMTVQSTFVCRVIKQ